jgi:RNA polymerase sigma-70 factor (ECF subfamily)
VQEAFLEVLRSLPSLRDEGALRPWLTTITVRVARAELRRRRLRRLFFREPEEAPPELSTEDDPAARAALRATWGVLSRLPVEERLAFTLRYLHGEELTAGAQALGCSLATYKRRLVKAEARFLALGAQDPEVAPWLAASERWRRP